MPIDIKLKPVNGKPMSILTDITDHLDERFPSLTDPDSMIVVGNKEILDNQNEDSSDNK